MKLQFLGATDTVCGYRYLVTHDQTRVLVDCGLFQGYKLLRLRNWAPPPVVPASITL
jgi:metallo-beta-lactamase family protein